MPLWFKFTQCLPSVFTYSSSDWIKWKSNQHQEDSLVIDSEHCVWHCCLLHCSVDNVLNCVVNTELFVSVKNQLSCHLLNIFLWGIVFHSCCEFLTINVMHTIKVMTLRWILLIREYAQIGVFQESWNFFTPPAPSAPHPKLRMF